MSFTWVPFYREVTAHVLEYEDRQDELLDLLREMKAAGLPTVPLEHDKPVLTPIEAIDPFTFMANFGRTREPFRLQICNWIRDKWDIQAPVPTNFEGCVDVHPNFKGSWFFGALEEKTDEHNKRLWQLARQAYDGDIETLEPELFQECSKQPNLNARKLSIGLSWPNPDEFLPLHDCVLRHSESLKIAFDKAALLDGDLIQYKELMGKVRQHNPDLVAFVAETQNDKSKTMNFTWVPFYREVAEHVLKYENSQTELVKTLREIEADGTQTMYLLENQADGEMTELEEMDPFTFLANFSRTGDVKAGQACRVLKEKWDLRTTAPVDFDGRVKVSPIHPWFFSSVGDNRVHDDISRLWKLAKQVLQEDVEKLDTALFERCLKIRGVGVGKLTTGLFWLAPTRFLSVTAPIIAYLAKQGVNCNQKQLEKGDFDEYQRWLKAAREVNEDFLEISHRAWEEHINPPNPIIVKMRNFPLNQILYGPPGTGKTYSTIERAVEIIDGVAAWSHVEAKARFDELRANGQIEFVTFHQSFSYEEFIEGLRPILDEDGEGTARYEVRAGVLKTLALRALASALEKQDVGRATFEQLWNQLLEKIEDEDWILPGLGTSKFKLTVTSAGNLTGSNVAGKAETRFSASRAKVEKVWEALRDETNVTHATITQVLKVGAHTNLIGAVVEEIKRLSTQPKLLIAPQIEKSSESAQSFLHNSPDYRASFTNAPRYVLIVDEINRGNISKILGELITLLEPDKRIGAPNELRVQLPVSGDQFALPPNLYLLGTMNTADKSLALLDVALRRRFDFIEMAPDISLFPEFAREVLTQLNLRLEAALDREHRIGHAVFIGCDESQFDEVFRKKIIPLLQEFFYNDWENLRAVLGESGDNGDFIKKLVAPPGMKARTKWRWWFDEEGAGEFDILAVLEANYRL